MPRCGDATTRRRQCPITTTMTIMCMTIMCMTIMCTTKSPAVITITLVTA